MRKYLLFGTFVILFQSLSSQTWCIPGAKWYYSAWSSLLAYNGLVEYSYISDTVLSGKPCNVIRSKCHGKFGWGSGVPACNRLYYTYMDNEVLYIHNGTSFDTVVDYKASVGDSWETYQLCGERYKYTVTNKSVFNYGGVANLRYLLANYTFTYVNQANVVVTATATVEFREKILGGSWEDLFLKPCPGNPEDSQERPFNYFCGYTDRDIPLKSVGYGGCGLLTGMNEKEKRQETPGLYPNPNTGNFSLQIQIPAVIRIYTSLGELIYEHEFENEGSYDLSLVKYPAGVYYLQSTGSSSGEFQKLLKQ